MKVSEILNGAADVIEVNGWARGQWYIARESLPPEECPMCAGAALSVAADCIPDYCASDAPMGVLDAAFMALAVRVAGGVGDHVNRVAMWNDEASCTAAEVIAELRAAAREEAEAGR